MLSLWKRQLFSKNPPPPQVLWTPAINSTNSSVPYCSLFISHLAKTVTLAFGLPLVSELMYSIMSALWQTIMHFVCIWGPWGATENWESGAKKGALISRKEACKRKSKHVNESSVWRICFLSFRVPEPKLSANFIFVHYSFYKTFYRIKICFYARFSAS